MIAKRELFLNEYTSNSEKRKAALQLARDPEGGKVLVGLAADGKLSDELIKAVGPAILKNPDQSVRTMAKEYFSKKLEPKPEKPAIAETATAKVPAETTSVEKSDTKGTGSTPTNADSPITQIAMLTGNEQSGRTVFRTNCATCHRHGQQGADIGPDLTKIHQKLDKNGLLDAILYPSAGIAFGYEPWLITTKKGQTFYGFLVSDSEQSVVIKGIKGFKHTIPADQIFSRRQYKTSLMPDPAAMGLNNQQLADLTAFLLKQ